jgi:ribosomal protein L11 methyltransferase
MITTVARLPCDEPTARRLAAALDLDDAVISVFEADGRWQLAIHFRTPPDEAALRALVRDAGGDAARLDFEQVAETDWVAQSLAGLKPVRAGRFIVHGAHDRARVPVNTIAIEIEAALAFGSGHHGTTRGCLLALDALAKPRRRALIPAPARGRVASGASRVGISARRTPPRTAFGGSTLPFQGRDKKRILDIGTGSGVLAIAAAKRLRTPVVASDIDAVAVVAGRANARLNRVAAMIAFARAAGTRSRLVAVCAPYDLIFANILLGPLLRLAVPLGRLAAPGAHIVLSGLLPSQANAVLALYRAQGFALERRIALEGWVTLVLKRNCAHCGTR